MSYIEHHELKETKQVHAVCHETILSIVPTPKKNIAIET